MRKFLSFLLVVLIFYFGLTYKDQIREYVMINFINKDLIIISVDNIYAKESNTYKETNDFYPDNKEDIINIFYTALNGGWPKVVFFCTLKYKSCIDDVVSLSKSNDFNKVNNYVSPYNSYNRIILEYTSTGKVEISFERLYSKEEIIAIEKKVKEVIDTYITNNMTQTEKIRAIHDYIINNTIYDEAAAEKVKNNSVIDFTAHKANGALLDGKAICGGYSDAMATFLNHLDIPNYKISSTNHVWNYVYVNNKWLHLDLTWDDPVTNTHQNMLLHSFFLVTDEELMKLDTTEHTYK